jgi:hypothetical protein
MDYHDIITVEPAKGGYILAPAKPLRREAPTENAVAVIEELVDG